MLRSAAFVIAMVTARIAHAEPDDLIAKPLVLAPGHADAFVTLEDDISSGLHGAPLSLAPDVWVGVLPQLTVGVIHSDLSVDRIGPGASFCIETQRIICPNAYHGTGLDALYSIETGSFSAAVRARALIRDFHPYFLPAVTLGALLRWHRGRWSITGDPFVQIGLDNNRFGNYSAIWLPVVFAVQPIAHVAIELHTGWNSDFYDIADGWYTPAALGVRGAITPHLELGVLAGWLSIFGPQNDEKLRVLMFDVGWHS
ncbi:MAG TPA: hypothetical protein VGG28_21790 [Kofleriaceae bacterium]